MKAEEVFRKFVQSLNPHRSACLSRHKGYIETNTNVGKLFFSLRIGVEKYFVWRKNQQRKGKKMDEIYFFSDIDKSKWVEKNNHSKFIL